jgi:putative nucleotidyltransferase with HDIG domain
MTATSSVRLPNALRQLPPLPRALQRALELIQNPNSTRTQLAEVLSLDPGLTGVFLRMVNSAYYGLPRRITSVEEAVGYLGYETVQSVIFATSANKILSGAVPAYKLERGMLWKHAVAVAAGASWIAKQRQIGPASEVYVAGLLHDVGKLVIDLMLRQQSQTQELWDTSDKQNWMEMERNTIGHDHAEVGAIVARSWNLPDRVVEAIAYHHVPTQALIDPRFIAAVHVANIGALAAGLGLGVDSEHYMMEAASANLIGWNDEEMAVTVEVMQQAVEKAEETLGLPQGGALKAPPAKEQNRPRFIRLRPGD